MFVVRLSHSGQAFHVAFATQAKEAFLEGPVLAFEDFGAVPAHGRHQQQPVKLKLARALNLASNARDTLVMRRLLDGDNDQRRRDANCRARAQTTCPLRPINAGNLRSLPDSPVHRLTCGQAG